VEPKFDEEFYLLEYPDIAKAVKNKRFKSGYDHYKKHGKKEKRRIHPYSKEEEFPALIELVKAWPAAVPQFMICDENDEDEKFDRADGIIELFIEDPLTRFLDFGCGEGHTIITPKNNAKVKVGYDIIKPKLKEANGGILTNDLNIVNKLAPFDQILIYDVLDHCKNPTEVLKKAKELLSAKGIIYLQCHPWISRHGAHQYRKLNKAFIHLVFSEQELKEQFDFVLEDSLRVTNLTLYEKWISESKLKVISKNIEKQDVERAFFKQLFNERLKINRQDMQCCFIKFKLSH